MILGIGNDLVDIRRIEKALKRFGEKFEQRVFTLKEREKAHSREKPAATYAKRFAAKEACIKALGIREVSWQEMEITNDAQGAASIHLTGIALAKFKRLGASRIHVSMTDEYPYAQAIVIIESD